MTAHFRDLEMVGARLEELPRFREGQAVLSLVAVVLGVVPLEVHGESVRHWRSK